MLLAQHKMSFQDLCLHVCVSDMHVCDVCMYVKSVCDVCACILYVCGVWGV